MSVHHESVVSSRTDRRPVIRGAASWEAKPESACAQVPPDESRVAPGRNEVLMAYRNYPKRERTTVVAVKCPTCKVNNLTAYEARKGYQCDACTRRDEGAF